MSSIRTIQLRLWFIACIAALCVMPTMPASAADVSVSVSPRETYVNAPVYLIVTIDNATSFEEPRLPEIDGAQVDASPQRSESSQVSIINGQVSQRKTVALTYRITPRKQGTITIPEFEVIADGKTYVSDPIPIVVAKSETGDLLLVDVQADASSIYLGQPLNLTLRIWIKPYLDQSYHLRLGPEDMWGLISFESSELGEFESALSTMRDRFGRWTIRGQEVLREDSSGQERAYYRFDIPLTIWPERAGLLAIKPPTIAMQYPVRLVRQNDFFTRGYAVSQARPISATAEMPPVEIRNPPVEGQPDAFNGAVGRFDFQVTAKPTDVAVGDPITLTMTITDRTADGTRLETLPPPALDRVSELTAVFRMPSDPLAGTVNGRVKTFTQTIRPMRDDITEIPAIPFTFFDPLTEKYITRTSDPIPIKVAAASKLSLADVVQANGAAAANNTTELTEVAGGILANYSDVDAMLARQAFRFDWTAGLGLAAPPLLFGAIALSRRGLLNGRRNEAASRRRTARKRALEQISRAQATAVREQGQLIMNAVCTYVGDRIARPGGSLTHDELIAILRERGAPEQDIADVDRLLDQCEQLAYGGAGGTTAGELAQLARECVDRLERSGLR